MEVVIYQDEDQVGAVAAEQIAQSAALIAGDATRLSTAQYGLGRTGTDSGVTGLLALEELTDLVAVLIAGNRQQTEKRSH